MTFPEPQFQRVTGTRLFWLEESGRRIGYFASPPFVGEAPLLSATWHDDPQGVYLLVGSAPVSDAAFAAALPGYLVAMGWPYGPKFLWLADPNITTWVGQTLDLAQSGTVWTVRRRADFRLCNYTVTVASGSAVTLAAATQNWGFSLAGEIVPAATLFAPGGQYDIDGGNLLLPFAGAQAGCWRFAITLANHGGSPDDFARLGVGLRYFYPAPPGPDESFVRALHLPAIVQPDVALRMDVSIDPLRATAPDRSWLSFFPLNSMLPPFASTFATARGHGATLTPLAAWGTEPDARLVFGVHPRHVGPDPVPIDYYLTLQGAFSLIFSAAESATAADATGTMVHRLLCGTSGIEYLGMPQAQQSQLHFVPCRPAFASLADAASTASPLSLLGTTSWVWASNGANVRYYAQPEAAPLYRAPEPSADTLLGSAFLDYLEVAALQLAPADGKRCFPLAPYRSLDPEEAKPALAIEAAALAPVRRQAILSADTSAWVAPLRLEGASPPVTSTVGVTPQGIAVGVGGDGMEWTWVGFANDTDDLQAAPNLVFTKADGAFRQALETNRLFMVAANGDTFMENASVKYQLTAEGLAELRLQKTVPTTVLDEVSAYFLAQHYPIYENEGDFVAALNAASSGAMPYVVEFERKSGLLTPQIGDWQFQISPRNWSNPQRPERQNVLMVFKFNVGRSLAAMTDDLPSWTWPEVAVFPGGTSADAQAELQSIYRTARESYARTSTGGAQSPYANFIRVLDDENWTGIMVFSCDMPLKALPAPLQALAAGIDPKRFYAHHIGFSITPFGAQPGVLQFGKTSMFGLLDYQDTEDQYFEDNRPYMFKVLRLAVGFRNSVMVEFSSQVELLINRFFGAPALFYPTSHGNNLILDGVYQRQKDQSGIELGTYVFSMTQQNTVGIANSALRWVQLSSTQLVTTTPADTADPYLPVVVLFQMAGNLYFYEPKGFDPFSFGQTRDEAEQGTPAATAASALRFGNLAVRMEFTLAECVPSFSFVTEALSFDPANSMPRPKALYACFPIKLSGFLSTPDPELATSAQDIGDSDSTRMPESFGYASIGAPLQQSRLRDPWYGLVYDIDLGSLGALAGNVGLTLRLLAAWSSGGTREEPAVYLGVKLPGVKESLGVELPLQGILSLGFKSIQILADDDATTGARQYLLRFRNFAIRFLGLAFPPGYNDILLAGSPDAAAPTKLGWYAAYSADEDPKKKKQPSRTTRLVAARKLPASLLASARNKR